MTDKQRNRRHLLAGAVAGLTVFLAGCAGPGDDDGNDNDDDDGQGGGY